MQKIFCHQKKTFSSPSLFLACHPNQKSLISTAHKATIFEACI